MADQDAVENYDELSDEERAEVISEHPLTKIAEAAQQDAAEAEAAAAEEEAAQVQAAEGDSDSSDPAEVIQSRPKAEGKGGQPENNDIGPAGDSAPPAPAGNAAVEAKKKK